MHLSLSIWFVGAMEKGGDAPLSFVEVIDPTHFCVDPSRVCLVDIPTVLLLR
jgi:hypothetical protein